MHTVIVFNHPYSGSYCNAVLQAAINGLQKGSHTVDIIHLDNDGFNPVMTAEDLKAFKDGQPVYAKAIEYGERINRASHLVLIFPVWWELMPAMMKGFIDKVIFPGIAYDYDNSGRFPRMVKRFKNLGGVTLITTMNTQSFFYRLIFGNAIKKALFAGTFWKMGYKNRLWINLNMVKFVSPQKRAKWLVKIERYFAALA
ncbi:MAG TPA: NAD(P)H-dependent oxidoreductase [Chitinophagaceae bacterium]|nr:NAD(P)H-dependent oxidoreductase [Chitinophagaceae bacterium]